MGVSQVWASTMNKNVMMGRENIMAKALTCKCSGRIPRHGLHNIRLIGRPMLVHLMMGIMIHKWAMRHTTLCLCSIVGSQEIDDSSL